jgi:peptide deformylase
MKSDYTRKNIITLPNPRLREKSAKIREINDETLRLIDDMLAATLDWEASRPHEVAVALAAVQIDKLARVIIVREDFDDKDNHNFTVLINPEIVKLEGEIMTEQEGCLSVKDVYGLVPRYSKVRVKAIDISGREVRFKSPNPFLARVLQHEIDHCNGICFVDHIANDHDAFSILREDGELEPIEYEKVREMGILPDEEK